MTWDLDRVEWAAKTEGFEVERWTSFVAVKGLIHWFDDSVKPVVGNIDDSRKALAAYDAIVARMARELPSGWRATHDDSTLRHRFECGRQGDPVLLVNRRPAHYPEAAKALRELADWLERQAK